MPLYEYQCDACGRTFEQIQKFADPPLDVCPSCGQGPVRRLLSAPAFQFKGAGWYVTDYARKGKSDESSEKKKGTTEAPAAKTGSTDSKSATPSDVSSSTTPGATKKPSTTE